MPESRKVPYLSIIASSRNDEHGGSILKRMTMFVRGLIEQSNRHRLPVELLMVEWNPPPDRPLLRTLLPQPGEADYLDLRYVVVPPEVHNRFKRAKEIPLFQMIAKNVGIRRARGEFVLCTNVDLLFSDPLFAMLARRRLRNDTFYRANRCDVPDAIDPGLGFAAQLAWCNRNIIRRSGRDMAFRHINLQHFGLEEKSWFKKWLFDKMAIGFMLNWPLEKREYYLLDTFACGDFTLMSRDAWLDIEGYVELDLYSLHVDTLGVIAAAGLGYRQETLPGDQCVFHIDHPSGWNSMGPFEKMMFLSDRPGIDYGLVFDIGLHALREKKRFNINPRTWGFSDHQFEEFSFPGTR